MAPGSSVVTNHIEASLFYIETLHLHQQYIPMFVNAQEQNQAPSEFDHAKVTISGMDSVLHHHADSDQRLDFSVGIH